METEKKYINLKSIDVKVRNLIFIKKRDDGTYMYRTFIPHPYKYSKLKGLFGSSNSQDLSIVLYTNRKQNTEDKYLRIEGTLKYRISDKEVHLFAHRVYKPTRRRK